MELLFLISNDIGLTTRLESFKNSNDVNRQDYQTIEQRSYLDEFLIWNNPITLISPTFDEKSSPPYIVLMECQINKLHVGKYNPIAVADLVQFIIAGKY